MKLSIVTTINRSDDYLAELHRRVTVAAKKVSDNHELIIVNDGAPDETLQQALAIVDRDSQVMVVDLSRSFGHHRALMEGLSHASGDRILLIDCDPREEPELVEKFTHVMDASGADVVHGIHAKSGGPFESFCNWVFFSLFNAVSPYKIPRNLMTIRLMSRRYVKSLLLHRERELMLSGLWAMTGYTQVPVVVDRPDRRSLYGLLYRVGLMVHFIISFTHLPLLIMSYLGLAILAVALTGIVSLVGAYLQRGNSVPGWASVIVSVWFVGGLIIVHLSVIGAYISTIFLETKRRPLTIVRALFANGRSNLSGSQEERNSG